jgi:hypothetical protein
MVVPTEQGADTTDVDVSQETTGGRVLDVEEEVVVEVGGWGGPVGPLMVMVSVMTRVTVVVTVTGVELPGPATVRVKVSVMVSVKTARTVVRLSSVVGTSTVVMSPTTVVMRVVTVVGDPPAPPDVVDEPDGRDADVDVEFVEGSSSTSL